MAYYLGMDIGGTSAKYGIVNSDGEILSFESFQTDAFKTQDALIEKIYEVVEKALPAGISGIGICSLGVINTQTGEILGSAHNMPVLTNLNLRKLLTDRFNIETHIVNDAFAAARGELWLGAGKGHQNFFCITLGTGFGGCAVVNGRILEGAHFRAGEIGFLDFHGENDYLEKRLSTKFFMEYASKKLAVPSIDGVEFFDKVKEGIPEYLSVFDEWMEGLSRVIANIIILLDPEKVIIGGGVSDQKELLLNALRVKVDCRLPADFAGQTKIDMAKCSNKAGILGAVSYFIF